MRNEISVSISLHNKKIYAWTIRTISSTFVGPQFAVQAATIVHCCRRYLLALWFRSISDL